MRQVQEAFEGLDIRAHAGVWRPISGMEAEEQYVTYVTVTREDGYCDDEAHEEVTYVYMNLYSKVNPNEMAGKIRRAMKAHGFQREEESTGSSSGEADYHDGVKRFQVSWTWVYREEIGDGA